jgi:RNA polymerase sigma-70 factor (ECF subfamily)
MSSAAAQELCSAAGIAPPDAALDAAVTAALAQVRAAWPAFATDDLAFARFVGARLSVDDADGDAEAALAALRVEDLYLTWACLRGDAAALSAFERTMAEPIRLALARINVPDAVKQDAAQQLRERLFVGVGGGTPRLAEFGGRGQLRRWVQAAVARVCLDQVRSRRREVPLDESQAEGKGGPSGDAELDHLRRIYGPIFELAFAAAIPQLEERDRDILRHHLVEGMTIDDIGERYRVHRTTAFRWIESARETLVELTRNEMMKRLRVEAREVESILRVIRSEVHLSVQRLFSPPA